MAPATPCSARSGRADCTCCGEQGAGLDCCLVRTAAAGEGQAAVHMTAAEIERDIGNCCECLSSDWMEMCREWESGRVGVGAASDAPARPEGNSGTLTTGVISDLASSLHRRIAFQYYRQWDAVVQSEKLEFVDFSCGRQEWALTLLGPRVYPTCQPMLKCLLVDHSCPDAWQEQPAKPRQPFVSRRSGRTARDPQNLSCVPVRASSVVGSVPSNPQPTRRVST